MVLHQMLMNGGPEERKGVPEQARLYWSYRDEISTAFDVPVNLSFVPECRLSLEKRPWPVVHGFNIRLNNKWNGIPWGREYLSNLNRKTTCSINYAWIYGEAGEAEVVANPTPRVCLTRTLFGLIR